MTTQAIKEAVEFEDAFLQDKIERTAYEQREKAIRDYYSYISAFKEEGLEQGLQEGLQQGIRKVAINLLKANMPIDFIAQNTGLNEQEILRLQELLTK
jgi:predicted transposase/invertase (TIGR01784 family)